MKVKALMLSHFVLKLRRQFSTFMMFSKHLFPQAVKTTKNNWKIFFRSSKKEQQILSCFRPLEKFKNFWIADEKTAYTPVPCATEVLLQNNFFHVFFFSDQDSGQLKLIFIVFIVALSTCYWRVK